MPATREDRELEEAAKMALKALKAAMRTLVGADLNDVQMAYVALKRALEFSGTR